MKRKLIPPFLMLFMGAIAGIIMLMLQYEVKTMLFILLGVLFGFYIIGCLIKMMLDIFDKQNEARRIMRENEKLSDETIADEREEGRLKSQNQ